MNLRVAVLFCSLLLVSADRSMGPRYTSWDREANDPKTFGRSSDGDRDGPGPQLISFIRKVLGMQYGDEDDDDDDMYGPPRRSFRGGRDDVDDDDMDGPPRRPPFGGPRQVVRSIVQKRLQKRDDERRGPFQNFPPGPLAAVARRFGAFGDRRGQGMSPRGPLGPLASLARRFGDEDQNKPGPFRRPFIGPRGNNDGPRPFGGARQVVRSIVQNRFGDGDDERPGPFQNFRPRPFGPGRVLASLSKRFLDDDDDNDDGPEPFGGPKRALRYLVQKRLQGDYDERQGPFQNFPSRQFGPRRVIGSLARRFGDADDEDRPGPFRRSFMGPRGNNDGPGSFGGPRQVVRSLVRKKLQGDDDERRGPFQNFPRRPLAAVARRFGNRGGWEMPPPVPRVLASLTKRFRDDEDDNRSGPFRRPFMGPRGNDDGPGPFRRFQQKSPFGGDDKPKLPIAAFIKRRLNSEDNDEPGPFRGPFGRGLLGNDRRPGLLNSFGPARLPGRIPPRAPFLRRAGFGPFGGEGKPGPSNRPFGPGSRGPPFLKKRFGNSGRPGSFGQFSQRW